MEQIKKQKRYAFGKDIYLLGTNTEGKTVWLEAANWDCSWYWGFGYIETYTNNDPENARDMSSHSHYSGLTGKQEKFNNEKSCFILDSKYIYHINEHSDFKNTTLTDKEAWQLSDLMKTFYTLKDTAELFHSGNSNLTSTPGFSLKNEKQEKHINEVLLPQVFQQIYELLSPINEV